MLSLATVSSEELNPQKIPSSISCLMGKSNLFERDFPMVKYAESTDFFSKVAVAAIKKIINSKPYDQDGVEFKVDLFQGTPKLTGYIVIKESYQQISLANARCEQARGNNLGFGFKCILKNPIDSQKLYLSYLYKYKKKLGVFALKVSEDKIGLMTKNIFSCE